MKTKYFNVRGFVSLVAGFGFLVMAVSGIALDLSPRGRIADIILEK